MKAIVFLADGFEECEGLIVVDILRRAGVETLMASVMDDLTIDSSRHIKVQADVMAADVDYDSVDLIVLPGGRLGTENLGASKIVTEQCIAFAKRPAYGSEQADAMTAAADQADAITTDAMTAVADQADTITTDAMTAGTGQADAEPGARTDASGGAADKYLAAICAAPSLLAKLGLLEGKKATCHPDFEGHMAGAALTGESVAQDGNIITGQGLGATFKFAFRLVDLLAGEDKTEQIKKSICYR